MRRNLIGKLNTPYGQMEKEVSRVSPSRNSFLPSRLTNLFSPPTSQQYRENSFNYGQIKHNSHSKTSMVRKIEEIPNISNLNQTFTQFDK